MMPVIMPSLQQPRPPVQPFPSFAFNSQNQPNNARPATTIPGGINQAYSSAPYHYSSKTTTTSSAVGGPTSLSKAMPLVCSLA